MHLNFFTVHATQWTVFTEHSTKVHAAPVHIEQCTKVHIEQYTSSVQGELVQGAQLIALIH